MSISLGLSASGIHLNIGATQHQPKWPVLVDVRSILAHIWGTNYPIPFVGVTGNVSEGKVLILHALVVLLFFTAGESS